MQLITSEPNHQKFRVPLAALQDRKTKREFQKVAKIKHKIKWYTCDPTGRKGKSLSKVLSDFEDALRTSADSQSDGKLQLFVIEIDKARQTPINALGGKEEGGEAAMKAYLDLVESAVNRMADTNKEIYKVSLNRVSPTQMKA